VESKKLQLTALQPSRLDFKSSIYARHGQQGLNMRKTLFGRLAGILLALLAVGSMTLLQVARSTIIAFSAG
jgi:hypothetical protein